METLISHLETAESALESGDLCKVEIYLGMALGRAKCLDRDIARFCREFGFESGTIVSTSKESGA